jgi:predicted PurR-regulated permease PerM
MSPRKQRIVLGILLAVLVLFSFGIAWPFASALVLSALLAVMMYPVNRRLSRVMRPSFASFLTTLLTVAVLGTTFTFVCVTAVKTTKNAYTALNQRSDEQRGSPGRIVGTTDRIVDAVATRLPVPKETIRAKVLSGMETVVRYLFVQTEAAIQGIVSIVVTNVLAVIFLYYFLRHGEGWLRSATTLIPLNPDITGNLLRAAHQSIIANVNGVLVVAAAQGLFLSIGFWFVGIRSPLQWGVFGAIASVIPFVGASLVWVPAVIGFVVTGAYWKALMLGLWGGLVVGSLDNILRPLVVGAHEKQNPVLVGFAMLGGTYLMGPLGLLFGPLVVSMTGAVVEELKRLKPVPQELSRVAGD